MGNWTVKGSVTKKMTVYLHIVHSTHGFTVSDSFVQHQGHTNIQFHDPIISWTIQLSPVLHFFPPEYPFWCDMI